MGSLFSQFRRSRRRSQQQQSSQQDEDVSSVKKKGSSTTYDQNDLALVPGSPWSMHLDHEHRPFWWNNVTGQWTYQTFSPVSLESLQVPSPQPMAYVTQGLVSPPPHHNQPQSWLISPVSPAGAQAIAPWGGPVLIPVVATPSAGKKSSVVRAKKDGAKAREGPREKKNTKLVSPSYAWERCHNEEGKVVWIHAVTGKITEIDPYE